MKEIVELVIAGLAFIVTALGTGYGIAQYKEKKLGKQTDKAVKDALEAKEVSDIRIRLDEVVEDLDEIKERFPEIVTAIASIKDIQILMGQFEMRCNLLHKENK